MRILGQLFLILAIQFACLNDRAFSQSFLELTGLSPYNHYKTFDTPHFHFIYQEGYFDFAKKAAEHSEHAHEILSPILKWQPRAPTTVLIADNTDAANGLTMPALRVGIVLIATPPDAWLSTSHTDDWIKLLVFHEYTHFLNIDPTTEWMEAFRLFFGDIIRPNGLWPIWMLEGLAVYYETRTSLMGRGRSPYYEAILRAYVNEGKLNNDAKNSLTLDQVNGDLPYFPGGEIPYLFGYHLWDQFSRDRSVQKDTDAAMGELSLRSSARVPFFLEGNLQNVMNKNWAQYWDSFVESTHTRMTNEINAIKAKGETPSQLITKAGYAATSGLISPNGRYLAYTEASVTKRTRVILMDLEKNTRKELAEKIMGAGMSFTSDSRYLIYSSLVRFNTYSLFSDLFSYDVKTGNTKQLTSGARAKDPALSLDGKWLVYLESDHATHILKFAPFEQNENRVSVGTAQTLYTPSSFSILGTPKFLNNKELIFSRQELGPTQSDLIRVNLETKKVDNFLADGELNRFPVVSKNKVYFVSSRTGIENIYSVNTDGKEVKQVTNVITRAEFPFLSPKDELYASLLTSSGFEIAKFTSLHPTPATREAIANPSAPATLPSALSAPKAISIEANQTADYSPWSSMKPRQWAPLAYLTYGSNAGTSLGGIVFGFDSSGKQQYYGLAGYNFKPGTVDGTFNYTLYAFRPIIDLSLQTTTTDIAADSARSQYRRSSEVRLGLEYPILWTFSGLRFRTYGFTSWNKVYDLNTKQSVLNNDFEYSNPLVPGLGASLTFSDAEKVKLGFVPISGNDFTLAAEDKINGKEYSVIKYLASFTHYFDLGNTAVLMPKVRYLASTHTTGFDRSFARLEGKHTEDSTDEGRSTSLSRLGIRGYPDISIYRKSAGVGSLDFHFPMFRLFKGAGDTTPAFFRQLHGFVFGESAYVPSSRFGNQWLSSFGGGTTLDTTLLIRAPIQFTLQYQQGLKKEYGADKLLFLSISAGSLF